MIWIEKNLKKYGISVRWNKETGDRMGAGLCTERKALWRDSDTVPEAVIKMEKQNRKIKIIEL